MGVLYFISFLLVTLCRQLAADEDSITKDVADGKSYKEGELETKDSYGGVRLPYDKHGDRVMSKRDICETRCDGAPDNSFNMTCSSSGIYTSRRLTESAAYAIL